MPRPRNIHPDPLVRELEQIRSLRWSRHVEFSGLTLISDGMVLKRAKGSRDIEKCVNALRLVLIAVVGRLERREKKLPPPLDRSDSFAALALLRLDPIYENVTVESLQETIAKRWKRNDTSGHSVALTAHGFRKHLQRSFYERFAQEFRALRRNKGFDEETGEPIEQNGGSGSQAHPDELQQSDRDLSRRKRPVSDGRTSADKQNGTEHGQARTARDRHYRKKENLDKAFFERESTGLYIRDLASVKNLTIYAGAGVSADLGLPLHEALMPEVLKKAIGKPEELNGSSSDLLEVRLDRVISRLERSGSSAYLGSIARELINGVASDQMSARVASDGTLSRIIAEAMKKREAGGFLARGVGAFAFSMKNASKTAQVITTNYDPGIVDQAQKNLHTYFEEWKPYSFSPVVWPSVGEIRNAGKPPETIFDERLTRAKNGPDTVPLIYANGKLEEGVPIVAAELDFFYSADADADEKARQVARRELLKNSLNETDCLFVGSSVTDPDMLARLAETRSPYRKRYGLLLSPELEIDEGQFLEEAEGEYRLARRLIEDRFLHLGITPIMMDFPYQVPQFLREIALYIHKGDAYESYGDRLDRWWDAWHELLGYEKKDSNPGRRNAAFQWTWRDILSELRDGPVTKFLHDHRASKSVPERIMIEVWLRNPRSHHRNLFLWATSESLWLDGASAHWGAVNVRAREHYITQETFRQGRTQARRLDARRGHWKFCVSSPLILHEEPWYHLPIGVVNLLSMHEPSGKNEISELDYISRSASTELSEDFSDVVKSEINHWLDTEDPTVHFAERLDLTKQRMEHEACAVG